MQKVLRHVGLSYMTLIHVFFRNFKATPEVTSSRFLYWKSTVEATLSCFIYYRGIQEGISAAVCSNMGVPMFPS